MSWPGPSSAGELSPEAIAHIRFASQLAIDEGSTPIEGIEDALSVLDSPQARKHPEAVSLLLLGSTAAFLAQRDNLGMALASSALEVAQEQSDQSQIIRSHTHLGAHYSTRGNRARALHHLVMSVELADEANQAEGQLRGRINLMHWLTRIGMLDAAEGVAQAIQARGLTDRVPSLAGVFAGAAARLYAYRGEVDSTLTWARAAQQCAELDGGADVQARAVVASLQAAWVARRHADHKAMDDQWVWAHRTLARLSHRDKSGIETLGRAVDTLLTGSQVDALVSCGDWLRDLRGYTSVHPDDLQVMLNTPEQQYAGDRLALYQHTSLVSQMYQMVSDDGAAQLTGLGVLQWVLDVANSEDSDESRMAVLRAQACLTGTCLVKNRDWLKPLEALSERIGHALGLPRRTSLSVGQACGSIWLGKLAMAPGVGSMQMGSSTFRELLVLEYPRMSQIMFDRLCIGPVTDLAAHVAACAEETWDGHGPLGLRMQSIQPEAQVVIAARDWLRAARSGEESGRVTAAAALGAMDGQRHAPYMMGVLKRVCADLDTHGMGWLDHLGESVRATHPCDLMLSRLAIAQS